MNHQARVASVRDWTAPFTADDFLYMLERGAFEAMRAELVQGEIEKMMPADWTHGELNARLVGLLYPFAQALGVRVGVDVVIQIDALTVRAADIAILRPGATPGKALCGADILLVVEIAETTQKRDLGEKREEYGAAGIPAYWVVDSVARSTHSFVLDEMAACYGEAMVIPFGQAIDVPGLGGVVTID